jgi:TM2 domain-containing membrane protein YozV
MSKVVRVSDDVIFIGTADGGILEVRREDMDFEPLVGEEVEIFKSETALIITRKDFPQAKAEEDLSGKSGINITIKNENASNNAGSEFGAAATGKVVNKIAYVVLAIVIGDFGIHKFYAGKIGLGIVYLLFFWTGIPAIIGLIEGIVAAFKPADQNGNIVV